MMVGPLDPYPIVDFYGKRWPFESIEWVSLERGPIDFSPRSGYSEKREDYECLD